MKEHNMIARVSQLNKTEAEWNKLPSFKPFKGELIVYNPDEKYSYARIKVGDGETLLKDLPFSTTSAFEDHIKEHLYHTVIDCGRITDYKR